MGDIARQKWIENEHGKDYLGLDGNPVSRIPCVYPDSYSEYVVYKSDEYKNTDYIVSNFHLIRNNRKAFQRAIRKTWNSRDYKQSFHNKKPEEIEEFLNICLGASIKLTAVLQGCNINDGSPYWIFAYHYVKE